MVVPGVFVDASADGYYLALRSASRRAGAGGDLSFYGPFSTAAQVSFMIRSARALGLIGREPEPQPAAAAGKTAQDAAVAAARVPHLGAP